MEARSMTALEMAEILVRQFEGLRLSPYLDSAGIPTIGYGTIRINGVPVTMDTPPISPEQADQLLMAELLPTYNAVKTLSPNDATEEQIAACTSFAYNEGVGAFRGSTLLRKWLLGDVPAAADQFDQWIYVTDPKTQKHVVSKGLVNRRKMEKAVFLGQTKV